MVSLIGWLAVCFGAAGFGSRYMPGEWYAALRKPPWNPPSQVFAPVWTLLYAMMAVAAWRVWTAADGPGRRAAIGLFLVQLAVNATWSMVFFGYRALGPAVAHIVVLWALVALTIAAFARIDTLAAGLLAPYLCWISFASVLAYTVWRLNA